MVASVELVLERGERLELLVDKADNLQQQVMVSLIIFFFSFVDFFCPARLLLVTFLPSCTDCRLVPSSRGLRVDTDIDPAPPKSYISTCDVTSGIGTYLSTLPFFSKREPSLLGGMTTMV